MGEPEYGRGGISRPPANQFATSLDKLTTQLQETGCAWIACLETQKADAEAILLAAAKQVGVKVTITRVGMISEARTGKSE